MFTIRADHLPLKHLLEQKNVSPEQFKWLGKLWGLQYTIEYRKGRENKVADALSRVTDVCMMVVSSPVTNLLDRVKQSWLVDEYVQRIILELEQDPQSHSHFSWHQGLFKHKGRLVVGADQRLRSDLLSYFHTDPLKKGKKTSK